MDWALPRRIEVKIQNSLLAAAMLRPQAVRVAVHVNQWPRITTNNNSSSPNELSDRNVRSVAWNINERREMQHQTTEGTRSAEGCIGTTSETQLTCAITRR